MKLYEALISLFIYVLVAIPYKCGYYDFRTFSLIYLFNQWANGCIIQ